MKRPKGVKKIRFKYPKKTKFKAPKAKFKYP